MSTLLKELSDQNFQNEVINSALPVLVDFWAPWCGPCQKVIPIIEELAQKYKDKMKFAKVNTEEQPELSNNYHILSIPAMLLFNKGEQQEQVIGIKSKEELENIIQKYI